MKFSPTPPRYIRFISRAATFGRGVRCPGNHRVAAALGKQIRRNQEGSARRTGGHVVDRGGKVTLAAIPARAQNLMSATPDSAALAEAVGWIRDSSKITAQYDYEMSVKIRLQPAAVKASSWRSSDCSSVETRA